MRRWKLGFVQIDIASLVVLCLSESEFVRVVFHVVDSLYLRYFQPDLLL